MNLRRWMWWPVGIAAVLVGGLVFGAIWGAVGALLIGGSWGLWALLRRSTRLTGAAAVLASAAVVLVVAQLVPYGRNHGPPPVTAEPDWDSAATREFARRTCFDCHSNETVWPWYTSVAPISWVAQRHVDEGRAALNYSEWDRPQDEAGESAETVEEGEMPLFDYLLVHPDARLSDAEQTEFIRGLVATFGRDD